MNLRYVCLVVLFIDPINSVRPSADVDNYYNEDYDPFNLQGKQRQEGIFERFVRNLLDLLVSPVFHSKKLQNVVTFMLTATRKINHKYAERLSRRLRRIAKHRDMIKEDIQEYKNQYDKQLPKGVEFLKAMNEVFTLRENLLFEDYIYDLRDYATNDKYSVEEETCKIVDVITDSIRKISSEDKRELERKLKKAIKEYDGDVEDILPMFELF